MLKTSYKHACLLICTGVLLSACTSRAVHNADVNACVSARAVPPALAPFIDSMSAPMHIMDLPDYHKTALPAYISKQQAHEDIQVLRYLLDHAYSGRHYWQQQGVDFVAAYAALDSYIESSSSNTISTREFEEKIFAAFTGINDPHTAVMGHETREFFKRVRQYFASFVLEQRTDHMVVVSSDDASVAVGDIYLGPKEQLFNTLSPSGRQHYLFGRMSDVAVTSMPARFKSGTIQPQLHPCRIGEIRYDRFNNIMEISEQEQIPIVRSSSFWVEGKVKELEQFAAYGKQLRDKPYFIWNLLANDGGITHYPAAFIEGFNDIQQEESWEAHLHSTTIAQAYLPGKNTWSSWPAAWLDDATPLSDIPEYKRAHVRQVREEKTELIARPRRYWSIVKEKPEPRMGNYQGRLVILSNHRNGSAGNNALAMSKSVPNSLIVGENSNMSYAFANTRNFSLRHSQIKLRLPGRLIIHPANHMERGFLPDLWLDSNTPVTEVLRWLRQPEHYLFKHGK